jgi:hypothetical protein
MVPIKPQGKTVLSEKDFLPLFKWTSSREEHNTVSSVSRDGTNAHMYSMFSSFLSLVLKVYLCVCFPQSIIDVKKYSRVAFRIDRLLLSLIKE